MTDLPALCDRIEALLVAHTDWNESHRFSSEYSEARFDLNCALEEAAPTLLRAARANASLKELLADLRPYARDALINDHDLPRTTAALSALARIDRALKGTE